MTGEAPTYDAEALANVVIVLDEPQDVVNIAGVIRAMKNMGISRLRLVRPAEFDAYRIEGIAHRSDDVIQTTELFDSLNDALADTVLVVGATARARTAQRNYTRPREVAPLIVDQAREGLVAIVFGREDKGLSNEALDRCQQAVVIPTAQGYWSLNLAQACMIIVHEVFMAAGAGQDPLPRGRRLSEPASHEDVESMFVALERGLDRIEFFKARKPEAVLRTLRTVLSRTGLDVRESRLLRAIGFEISHFIDRRIGPG